LQVSQPSGSACKPHAKKLVKVKVGKAAPLRWLENRYMRRYLRGRGIEIGALWRRYPVHPGSRVWYLDRVQPESLKKQYADVEEKIFVPDLVAEATQLPVARGALDFVIASHVLEHLPFPLAALRVWYQTLAPGGTLLIKVSDKRYTFDFRRPRTHMARLLSEYERLESFDWRARYTDWGGKCRWADGDRSGIQPGHRRPEDRQAQYSLSSLDR
jgi:SAM-dependent methyltransferase